MLDENEMEVRMNLQNPMVHELIYGIQAQLRQRIHWEKIFAKKMKTIQKLNDQFEAESKDEANWEDISDKPYILQGKRIS